MGLSVRAPHRQGATRPPIGAAPALREVREVMGIPVIVEVSEASVPAAAIGRAFSWLEAVEKMFSTYRPDSEISRINRGELALDDAPAAVRSVLARCEALREQTGGYFDISAATAGEGIDPSGLVKGWAVQGAGRLLADAGARGYCVNAGGDICLRGGPPGREAWQVGIQHPLQRMDVAAVLSLSSGAVATSGAYERGDHVVDPHTGRPPEGVLSVSIVGPDLALADAYATAAFAMGRAGAEWAAALPGYGAIVIFAEETIAYSKGVERYLVRTPRGERPGPSVTAQTLMSVGGRR